MEEIKFDLGFNILETARKSGVPRLQVSNVAGLIEYSVVRIPASIPVRYIRPGYEISWQPVFGLSLWTDKDRSPDQIVDSANLQLDDKPFQTHPAAQAFVEQTIAQFQRGKWQRHHDPEWDVLLTGRSSLLDEHGQIAGMLGTIDPAYRISAEDWPRVADSMPRWRWVGDGVLATLSVTGSVGSQGLYYTMRLEFELLDVKRGIEAANQARELTEGDAKGWNSTAEYEAGKKKRAERNKLLIRNALQRGDAVYVAP